VTKSLPQPALSGELAERVGEIASGAFDAIGRRLQGLNLVR
jgi:hypothetical protein